MNVCIKNENIKQYDEIRSQLKNLDILLFSGDGVISCAIKDFTDSTISHVAILVRFDEYDRVMVSESMEGKGVRLIPLSLHLKNYKGSIIVARHPEAEKITDLKKIGQLAFDNSGREYDLKELARIAYRQIITKLGIAKLLRLKFKINTNDKEICSEWVRFFLDSFNISIPYNKNGYITPADFYNWNDINYLFRIK